jgi:phage terminase large subunit
MTECLIDYSFYGANRDAILCRDPEVMLAGPRDTGKTLAWLWKLDAVAKKYAGASIVIARKVQKDLWGTVLETFRREILDGQPVRVYGGERPAFYEYRNDSRIWTAGLDKPGSVLSAQHDIIYLNQAEEADVADWEFLTSTTTGRAGNVPYSQTVGDCNPGPPTHWIQQRRAQGALTFFESRHEYNPEIYDPRTGEVTDGGQARLDGLRSLTGVREKRLFRGLWVMPEGAIYEVFDEDKHKIVSFPIPQLWPRCVGIDPAGAHIAALWVAWDPKGEALHVYREYREPFGSPTATHVADILKMSKHETIFSWVGGGPGERQQRVDWANNGIPILEPPYPDVWAQIDRVIELIDQDRLFIHDCCVQTLHEIGSYRRKERRGQLVQEIEDKEKFDCLDCLRYICSWLVGEPGGGPQLVYKPVQIGGYR